jgi:hypothetical protein
MVRLHLHPYSPLSDLTLSSVFGSSSSSSSSDRSSFKSEVNALSAQLRPSRTRESLPNKNPHDQDRPEEVDEQQQHDGDKNLIPHPRGHVLPIWERLEDLSVLLGDEVPFVPYTDEYTEVLVVSEVVPDLSLSNDSVGTKGKRTYHHETSKDRGRGRFVNIVDTFRQLQVSIWEVENKKYSQRGRCLTHPSRQRRHFRYTSD